ncbi:hypothetical protein FAGAP_7978 [Fusarium agapanthi]|uniref:Uncharacterized protein n=1 Tax=Fusarium agapanthi TaxID=1803897 RepID=A0A9P5BC46_9HYPO|nr:hypothetical protein FAGAP_7978 [Fusarium agapanthi]
MDPMESYSGRPGEPWKRDEAAGPRIIPFQQPMVNRETYMALILMNCRVLSEGSDTDYEVLTRIDLSRQWHAFVLKVEGGKRNKCLEETASRPERALELLHETSARLAEQYVSGYGCDVKLETPFIARQTLENTHEHRIGNNKENLPLPTRKSSDQNYSSGSTDYIVKALVGLERHKVDALPDTGAKRNFVSQQLVDQLGLVPEVRVKERFRLPTGVTVESSGTVNVPFTFLGESDNYLLNCCILPKCTQDLILCQAFLKSTGTLTKFTRRITKSLRKFTSRLRVNLIEDDTCCLQGNFDDIPSIALADTGCDAMLISSDFARRHSLQIDKGFEHRRTIEYADGSLDTTTGIVYDSTWQFSSSWDVNPCNFYVLDDLKADIILSSHFIFEHEVFSQFEKDIIDTSLMPGREFGDIYNIRLIISHYSSALEHLEASSIADSKTTITLNRY